MKNNGLQSYHSVQSSPIPRYIYWAKTRCDTIEISWELVHTGAIDIGLGNDFVLSTREQALTWTNDDPAHWCMYISLGLFVAGNLLYHTVGGLKRVFQPTNIVI